MLVLAPDGSADELLDFAFHSAAARDISLLAVQGRSVPFHARMPWGVDHGVTEELTREAREELNKALTPWREKYPQVEVEDSIRLTSPAKAAVHAAEGAALLVVGRRVHRHGATHHLDHVALVVLRSANGVGAYRAQPLE